MEITRYRGYRIVAEYDQYEQLSCYSIWRDGLETRHMGDVEGAKDRVDRMLARRLADHGSASDPAGGRDG